MTLSDSARTIVCYGDSNTWGYAPVIPGRYPRSIRWPSVLQQLLGEEWEVISEGLGGRTLVAVDHEKLHRTGITHLQAILETNDPIEFVIVMLGTNDVKAAYGLTAEEIGNHLAQTIDLMQSEQLAVFQMPKILIICPPAPITPTSGTIDPRMMNAAALFRDLPEVYAKVAREKNCRYINAGDHITSGATDGYHLDAGAHQKLAAVVHEVLIRA